MYQVPVIRWDGEDAPSAHALNVLASISVDRAREVLVRWRNATVGCSIVVALPDTERSRLAKAELDGVAIVFPMGEDPVRFVKRTIDEISAISPLDARAGDRSARRSPPELLTELLDDSFGLGPRDKREWLEALKNHGSDV